MGSRIQVWLKKGAEMERRREEKHARAAERIARGAASLHVELYSPSRSTIAHELRSVGDFVRTDRDFMPAKREAATQRKRKRKAATRTKAPDERTVKPVQARKPRKRTKRKTSAPPIIIVQSAAPARTRAAPAKRRRTSKRVSTTAKRDHAGAVQAPAPKHRHAATMARSGAAAPMAPYYIHEQLAVTPQVIMEPSAGHVLGGRGRARLATAAAPMALLPPGRRPRGLPPSAAPMALPPKSSASKAHPAQRTLPGFEGPRTGPKKAAPRKKKKTRQAS